MKSTHLGIALLLINSCHAANRQPIENIEIPHKQKKSKEQIIYTPLSSIIPDHTLDETQEQNLFLALMAIAQTFGNILTNPSNTRAVIEQVTLMIDNVLYAADISSQSTKRGNRKQFIEALARYIQQEAQSLVNEHSQEKNDETKDKSAREKLIEYALQQQ